MKKILSWLIIFVLMSTPTWSFATDYYACNSSTAVQSDNWCTAGATGLGSCAGTQDTTAATALQAGNTLYANGCTLAITDTFTATAIKTTDGDAGGAAVAGGGFTLDLATVTGKTLTTAITAGSTDCLVISGAAGAGTVLTIIGAITGSTTTSTKHGVNDSHTGSTSVVVITGNITGGGSNSAAGYRHTGTSGIFTITGNLTGVNGDGFATYTATAGTTVTGSVIGSDVANGGYALDAVSSGGVTIIGTGATVGNITNGTRGAAFYGPVAWTPHAENWVLFKFGTDVYAGTVPASNDPTKVLADSYFVDSTSGTYTEGTATASAGGGGAWGF